jgi:hypothetical protein
MGAVGPSPERLEALVDEEKVAEVLALVSLDSIAETWCRYTRRTPTGARSHSDDDWWAIELWMTKAWWDDPARVRDGLLALVHAAQDDDDLLNCVGAGPLENYLADDENTLRWVEAQAAKSAAFRKALASVWVWGELDDSAASRIEAAAGVPLDRPRTK